jgi:hypothetical protein
MQRDGRGEEGPRTVVVEGVSDHVALARASLLSAEGLLELDAPGAARPRFERAIELYDEQGERHEAARARLGLGRTLLVLGDPACREVLEDAGTLFEELRDESSVRHVDTLLREAEERIEESPMSFQAGYGRMSVIPPTKRQG